MPSIWNSLLFLHGHVADPQLARRLAEHPSDEAPISCAPAPLTHGEAMRRLIDRGRRLSLRLCQGIGGGLIHMQ